MVFSSPTLIPNGRGNDGKKVKKGKGGDGKGKKNYEKKEEHDEVNNDGNEKTFGERGKKEKKYKKDEGNNDDNSKSYEFDKKGLEGGEEDFGKEYNHSRKGNLNKKSKNTGKGRNSIDNDSTGDIIDLEVNDYYKTRRRIAFSTLLDLTSKPSARGRDISNDSPTFYTEFGKGGKRVKSYIDPESRRGGRRRKTKQNMKKN